ncbi:MAG TPA: hypothetical protein VMV45_06055 [Casimicrobiaceae bacterium]|nr:hypothetical protein [Casimicrobiaceae bacterium]
MQFTGRFPMDRKVHNDLEDQRRNGVKTTVRFLMAIPVEVDPTDDMT